jgi:hypothetical protein
MGRTATFFEPESNHGPARRRRAHVGVNQQTGDFLRLLPREKRIATVSRAHQLLHFALLFTWPYGRE